MSARWPDFEPPLAPTPCWWTRTIVPSINAYSKSGAPDKASKSRSNTPLSAHRRNRLDTEFHFPKPSGRSRHGAPVRAIHSTASRKSRLSAPDLPGSPGLPGTSGAIRSHCSSLRRLRSKTALLSTVLNQNSRTLGIPNRMSTAPSVVVSASTYASSADAGAIRSRRSGSTAFEPPRVAASRGKVMVNSVNSLPWERTVIWPRCCCTTMS